MSDQYDGQGGSYVIENGVRSKVHNTVDHPDGNAPRPEKISEAALNAPAPLMAGDLADTQIGGE